MWRFPKFHYSSINITSMEQWKSTSEKLGSKVKGTFLEKWMKYWKLVVKDYKDVAINLKQEMHQKKLKSAIYITGLGFLSYCITHNPNLQSFRAKYVQCSNDLALVSQDLANPETISHLKYVQHCFNANLIRYMNLGAFSIVWIDKYSSECDTYESNCSYLQVPYRKFGEQILDVGFMNIWWITSRKMLDYDINY